MARTAGLLGVLSASPILVPALVPAVSVAQEAAPPAGTGAAAGAAAAEVVLMEGAPVVGGQPLSNLRVGQTHQLPVDSRANIKYIHGGELVRPALNNDVLMLTALRPGRVVVQITAPGQETQTHILRILPAGATVSSGNTSPSGPARVTNVAAGATEIASSQVLPATSTPAPAATVPSGMVAPTPTVIEPTVKNNGTSVSPPVLPPLGDMPSQVPRRVVPPASSARPSAQSIIIRQGLARLLTTNSNILAVFFSDENVMDARAINARTLAVTGKTPGKATLAIFTARSPDDVVGQARVYTVDIQPQAAVVAPTPVPVISDPGVAEAAIRAALDDRRISVSVIRTPAGTLAAVLTGTVHDNVEVDAAKRIAGFFVPDVVSSLVVDPKAPTLQQIMFPPEPSVNSVEGMQSRLRQLTGNETIELSPWLDNSLAVKAEVRSAEEAELLLNWLSALNRRVTPFIVIRSSPESTRAYTPTRPVLYGEDLEMTRRMQEVTGLQSIYVVRTADNALAVYGNVRNRSEYDRVRRYALVLPQVMSGGRAAAGSTTATVGPGGEAVASAVSPAPTGGTIKAATPEVEQESGLVKPVNQTASGFRFPYAIQLFVSVLDGSAVRTVNVETSVVEISRTSLRNLGVEFGSVALLSEQFTPPTPGTVVTAADGTQTVTAGTPGSIQRSVDPTFQQGTVLGGNGFIGTGGFSNIDPIRVRLNALYTKGNARVLSQPNLSAVEGAEAQITIGGQRPVPKAVAASGGGGAAVGTSVEFRRFGIILTMRPTVTDDDTIILQIRADVTSLDLTTGINLNGAFVPGERVRSVDTTLTVREGDILVMGGLITNDRSKRTSKIPILGDLPVIGSLFQSRRFENNESELAIFMTPRLTRRAVSAETLPLVPWIPALPPLPGLQQTQEIFQLGGSSSNTGG